MKAIRISYSKIAFAVICVALLALYFIFDPLESSWMPQCFFHKATGWQCMGCGSQRVVHALLHGDLVGAWRANAMMVISLPFLAFLVWLELRRKNHPKLYMRVHAPWLMPAAAGILLFWMITRNIFSI